MWRCPTAEYHSQNIHHTSAWPSGKAPLLSLGRDTEQQINKMQMAWITPQKDSSRDWGSTGVTGLKADNHPSNLFRVWSEVLALPLLLFVQGNYWFIYFYVHAFFMLAGHAPREYSEKGRVASHQCWYNFTEWEISDYSSPSFVYTQILSLIPGTEMKATSVFKTSFSLCYNK